VFEVKVEYKCLRCGKVFRNVEELRRHECREGVK
jgi:DNA-directed RNA polymerase subunit RPC12/RpoP